MQAPPDHVHDTNGGPKARRALVVDDPPSARTIAAEALRLVDLEVDLASSREKAYSACPSGGYDVVACDNGMRGISGVQLCRLLRGSPRTADVACVPLTSSFVRRGRFWARHAGADAHVSKEQLQAALGPQVPRLVAGPRRPPRANDPRGRLGALDRLAEPGGTSLFEATVAGQVQRLLDPGGDRRAITEATPRLCADPTDADVLALAVEGLEASATVRARRTLPAATDDALRATLGLRAHPESTVCEPEHVAGPPHRPLADPVVLPVRAGGVPCDEPRAQVERSRLAERDRGTLEIVALELGPIARTAFLVEESRRLAQVDALTGLFDRRYASERIEAELERARRYGGSFGVALFDLDHFKRIYDTHGHDVGDVVLQRAARCLHETARRSDASRAGAARNSRCRCRRPGSKARSAARSASRPRLPSCPCCERPDPRHGQRRRGRSAPRRRRALAAATHVPMRPSTERRRPAATASSPRTRRLDDPRGHRPLPSPATSCTCLA